MSDLGLNSPFMTGCTFADVLRVPVRLRSTDVVFRNSFGKLKTCLCFTTDLVLFTKVNSCLKAQLRVDTALRIRFVI